MTPEQINFSIVVIGAWNPSIFSAEWITKNLIEDEDNIGVEIAFPIEDATAPRRIQFSEFTFFPGRKKLEITPNSATLEGMQKCSSIVAKIMSLLSHTPVTDVGINFGFIETNPSENLNALFDLNDAPEILAKYTSSEVNINRLLKSNDDDCLLNLNMTEEEDTGAIRLKFNFHFADKGIDGIMQLFENEQVKARYDETISVSNSIYNLDLEPELAD